jgi:hypothetical protein
MQTSSGRLACVSGPQKSCCVAVLGTQGQQIAQTVRLSIGPGKACSSIDRLLICMFSGCLLLSYCNYRPYLINRFVAVSSSSKAKTCPRDTPYFFQVGQDLLVNEVIGFVENGFALVANQTSKQGKVESGDLTSQSCRLS